MSSQVGMIDSSRIYGRKLAGLNTSGEVPYTQPGAVSPALALLMRAVPQKGVIIDFGPGTGVEIEALAREGYYPVGVEYNLEVVEVARAGLHTRIVNGDRGLLDKIQLVQGDIRAPPANLEGVAEGANGTSVLHIFDKDGRAQAYEGIKGVLRPNGYAMISVKTGNDPTTHNAELVEETSLGPRYLGKDGVTRTLIRNTDAWIAEMRRYGLEHVEDVDWNAPGYDGPNTNPKFKGVLVQAR